MEERRYFTVAEAAARLAVSHDTILRLIHAGTLPAIRFSERLYRIPRPALERYETGEPVVRRQVVVRRGASIQFGKGERLPVKEPERARARS
jgi:excisionase family DNA binding protein